MHVNYRKTQPIYNDTEIQISLDFPEALYIYIYVKDHLLCNIIMHKLDDCKSPLTNGPKCSHNIYGHHAFLYSTCRNFPTPLLKKLASIISILVSFYR